MEVSALNLIVPFMWLMISHLEYFDEIKTETVFWLYSHHSEWLISSQQSGFLKIHFSLMIDIQLN